MSTVLQPSTARDLGIPDIVWVRVFHNNHTPDSLLYGYRSTADDGGPHSVTEVFTYPATSLPAEVLADEAFELFNVGHDPDHGILDWRALDYRARKNRSLSIGDVVAIDDQFLACARSGWEELPEAPPIEQRAAPGTTPLY